MGKKTYIAVGAVVLGAGGAVGGWALYGLGWAIGVGGGAGLIGGGFAGRGVKAIVDRCRSPGAYESIDAPGLVAEAKIDMRTAESPEPTETSVYVSQASLCQPILVQAIEIFSQIQVMRDLNISHFDYRRMHQKALHELGEKIVAATPQLRDMRYFLTLPKFENEAAKQKYIGCIGELNAVHLSMHEHQEGAEKNQLIRLKAAKPTQKAGETKEGEDSTETLATDDISEIEISKSGLFSLVDVINRVIDKLQPPVVEVKEKADAPRTPTGPLPLPSPRSPDKVENKELTPAEKAIKELLNEAFRLIALAQGYIATIDTEKAEGTFDSIGHDIFSYFAMHGYIRSLELKGTEFKSFEVASNKFSYERLGVTQPSQMLFLQELESHRGTGIDVDHKSKTITTKKGAADQINSFVHTKIRAMDVTYTAARNKFYQQQEKDRKVQERVPLITISNGTHGSDADVAPLPLPRGPSASTPSPAVFSSPIR